MPTGVYIVAPTSRYPLEYANTAALAEPLLVTIRREHAGARIITAEDYWLKERAKTMLRFPLSRVTAEFYDEMLGVLPPIYRRGAPGFFVSEAVTASIHSQFIEFRGRYYAGYADLAPDGRTWSYSDIDVFEAAANASTPTLSWFPPDGV